MKSWFCVLAVVALTTSAWANQTDRMPAVHFPEQGMSYGKAQAMLLRQGLTHAPDKPEQPDVTFPECDHSRRWQANAQSCAALYLVRDKLGWRHYVMVFVDLTTDTVISADYPSTPDGLPTIPPPLAKDVPQLKGSYLEAREKLKALGFTPARFEGERVFNTVESDESFKHEITISEAWCSGTGMSFCYAYWIAKNGRVLKVTTIWEFPQVHYVEWSSRKELRRDQREMRDERPVRP